jgi:C-terminal processing protease CtpA/Prc
MVTHAKLVMSDGGELEGHGVIPDSLCIPTPEDLRQKNDPCLDQAIALAKKSLTDKSQPVN